MFPYGIPHLNLAPYVLVIHDSKNEGIQTQHIYAWIFAPVFQVFVYQMPGPIYLYSHFQQCLLCYRFIKVAGGITADLRLEGCSWCHKVAQVGRDLKKSLVQSPAQRVSNQTGMVRALLSLVSSLQDKRLHSLSEQPALFICRYGEAYPCYSESLPVYPVRATLISAYLFHPCTIGWCKKSVSICLMITLVVCF